MPRGYPREVRSVGDHIRKRRLDLGLGQRNLGTLLGVRPETVANWELGRATPHVRHWPAVIRFLGYDPSPAGDMPGDRLRALRRELGLTQREVAARLGLDEGTVAEFELGRRRVSRKVAQAIDRLLRKDGGAHGTPSP